MIDFQNVGIHFTGENIFSSASFKINNSDKIALVGANGSGKSTILKLLTNRLKPTEGSILPRKNIKIGYLPQEFINTSSLPLFEEVRNSLKEIKEIELQENDLHSKIELSDSEAEKIELSHKLGELDQKKYIADYYSIDSQIEKVLMGLGFDTEEFGRPITQFSGGWQMRIELAKILLGRNDILLMDEPTNHLDIESLQWLVNYLGSYKGALLLVSHDKYFLNKLTNKTLELFNRQVTYYNGNYEKYIRYKDQRDEQLKAAYANQERKRKQTERFIERFRYKNTKAKQVQSRIKQLEKEERIELPDFESSIDIRFPPAPNSGAVPVEISDLAKSYGDKEVFEDISLQIVRGDKVAFVGPNGAGKTTLAKIIAGQLQPSSGDIRFGHNTFISYYVQEVADALNLESDILDIIATAAPDMTPGQIRSLLGSFLFTDDDVFKKIKVLSGGEKSRVALAQILVTKANLIILDEPTNHLDINSKEVLQKALIEYNGALVIVSHDIAFLRPITNKVYEIKGGSAKLYNGDIDYYLFKSNEDLTERSVKSSTSVKSDGISRKEIKRVEAEKRKQKFNATKELKVKIEILESQLAELESKKETLENELSKPEIFSNPALAKDKNSEYETVKTNLEELFNEWSSASEELEEIEATFED